MKKKIVFVAQNMNMNGANKSLCTLLKKIDKKKYDIDLFLYIHDGPLMSSIPKHVNILPENKLMRLLELDLRRSIQECNLKQAIFRIDAALKRLLKSRHPKEKYWSYVDEIDNEYDCAIAYHEGSPHRFVWRKIKAKKKIAWVHIDYSGINYDLQEDKNMFETFDKIIAVSSNNKKVLKDIFNFDNDKLEVIYNMIDVEEVKQKSEKEKKLLKNKIKHNCINITTVGRVCEQKGTDIAIKTCKLLIDKGYSIVWNIIGPGDYKTDLIEKYGLEDIFICHGSKNNPYPYIKECDIYVQPSRFEGWGISVTEAKILNKPMVVSNIPEFREQIEHNINGYVSNLTPNEICKGIELLINDDELRNRLILNLRQENLDNTKEIEKLEKLIS